MGVYRIRSPDGHDMEELTPRRSEQVGVGTIEPLGSVSRRKSRQEVRENEQNWRFLKILKNYWLPPCNE